MKSRSGRWRPGTRPALGIVFTLVALCGSIANAQGVKTNLPANLAEAGSLAALAAKAAQERALLIYSAPTQDDVLKWVAPFQERHGIKVQVYRAPSTSVYRRLAQELEAGSVKVDVTIYSGRDMVEEAISKGYYDKYTPANAGAFPATSVIAGYAYPFYATVGVVAWNTGRVPKELQTRLRTDPFNALLDPWFKGKFIVNNPLAGGTAMLNFALPAVHEPKKYGWEYVSKLAAQKPAVIVGVGGIKDSLIQGTYAASFFGTGSLFADAALAGAPVEFAFPNPTYASEFNMAIAHKAPHPHAARLFMEWATSQDAQNQAAIVTDGTSLMKGWTDRRAAHKLSWYKPPKVEDIWFGFSDPAFKGKAIEDFKARWSQIFGK